MKSSRQRRRDRNASVTLEFILVLPFLVVTLFAVAQYSVALLVRQAITQAAIVGAREAGKGEDLVDLDNVDQAEVVRAVDHVLRGAHCIGVSEEISGVETAVANSGVRIILQVGQDDTAGRAASTVFSDPNFNSDCGCSPPALPVLEPNEVRVIVCFDMRRHPVCNWLYSFSDDYVNFGNRYLSANALVRKE